MVSSTTLKRSTLALICAFLGEVFASESQKAFAQSTLSCGASNVRHDWDTNLWPAGSLSQSYTTSGETLAVNITGDTGFFLPDTSSAPVTSDYDTGGLVPAELSLELLLRFSTTSESVDITFDVGVAGEGVEEVEFSIFDVDLGTAAFQDQITITGSLSGAPVTPTLTASVANTVSGNVATGQTGAVETTSDGTVLVTFSNPIDQFVINYTNGPSAPNPPNQQAVSIHDIFTCPRLLPDISMSKTVAIYDPLNEGLHSVPGNEVIYTISASNSGTGPTDADSIVLIDALPPELTFFNGDIDDTGPATTPITFSQTNSPSLTFNYATDVAFSNAATRPSGFADCSYSPVSGYDPAINFICLNPKGQFEVGTPAPTFSVQFRSRIK